MIKLSIINMLFFLVNLSVAFGSDHLTENLAFRQFVSEFVPLRPSNGKIYIPESIKHVKLDIGLSYSAPMSQYWLSHEKDLVVFGFEPNPSSVNAIKNGAVKLDPSHGEPLELKYLDKTFFLIPCALGLSHENNVKFYITKESCGCCSIYEPSYFEVADVIDVPFFSLSDFFDQFPFDSHPFVEYIKIDAQGADLDIVKSAGDYLMDRVLYVTIEAEDQQYKNTTNSEQDIENYMHSIGFIRHRSSSTNDPTYVNGRFLEYIKEHEIKIYQNG